MINSHALLPTELWWNITAWRLPTLTGGNPQLPSALRSLTSVFGMGTGVSFLPSSPHYLLECLFTQNWILNAYTFWLSPRLISIGPLHMSPYFHFQPIYLIISEESYFLRMGNLISRGASRLDAFSVYPVHT